MTSYTTRVPLAGEIGGWRGPPFFGCSGVGRRGRRERSNLFVGPGTGPANGPRRSRSVQTQTGRGSDAADLGEAGGQRTTELEQTEASGVTPTVLNGETKHLWKWLSNRPGGYALLRQGRVREAVEPRFSRTPFN